MIEILPQSDLTKLYFSDFWVSKSTPNKFIKSQKKICNQLEDWTRKFTIGGTEIWKILKTVSSVSFLQIIFHFNDEKSLKENWERNYEF